MDEKKNFRETAGKTRKTNQ